MTVRIHFSDLAPGCWEATPLAQACGIGRANRGNDFLFSHKFDQLFAAVAEPLATKSHGRCRLAVFSTLFDRSSGATVFASKTQAAGLPCLFFDESDDIGQARFHTGLFTAPA